jgi:DNA-binding beta-propeller fold protein YncE
MTLYVCNRFEDDVSVIDLRRAGRAGGVPREMCRIPVGREPVAAAMTKDGKYLLVANELPEGRADVEFVAATVSVVDVGARRVDRVLPLPNGSCSLKDIAVSPDGRFAAVTHVIGRFKRTATSVVRGWMHVNAVTLIDLGRMRIRNTALLDDPDSGAADPWGVGWSADSRKLVVAHAGVDEVSVSDFPMLLEQLPELPAVDETVMKSAEAMRARIDGADNLPFLAGSRQRIKLSGTDRGPRALLVAGHRAYTANYFSGTLSVIDLDAPQLKAESIALGNEPEMDRVRKGEYYFNDGKLCYQGWQSCASCHPDGRADALNWDLLNDGVDNPKNTKSLLLAHQIGPAMTLGVRTNAEAAVRSGLQHILFTNATEEVAGSIDAYLKSLKPVPSPHLVRGRLAVAAKRGEKVFRSAGCADCHVPGLFTDLKPHDVGTRRAFDGPADRFYTPTLIEVWRTAPYLHDGSAATMREVLTTRNPTNEHGATKDLSEKELNDLCEYVLSL